MKHEVGAAVDVLLLGAVQAHAGPQVLDTGSAKQRVVLASLAVDAGRPVSAETLIDRLWETAPDGARSNLHVLVARVRRMLRMPAHTDGRTAPVRLLREVGGYTLTIDRDRVDLHRFRTLVERARQPVRCGGDRLVLLSDALDLWRGEPLAGLDGRWAATSREAWRQEYLDAAVAWADAAVEAGDPARAVGRLTELVDQFPLVEPLATALLRALHAAGRPAEALQVYRRIRRRLVDELGVEPGQELRTVHETILRADAGAAMPGAGSAHRSARARPAQLPRDAFGFVGRRGPLARLDMLLDDAGRRPATALTITVLSGPAGVGKSALAVHWAHRVAARFPDGQIHLNLRGFDPTGLAVTPAQAMLRLLDALDVPAGRIPVDLDAQAALFRSTTAGRRMLIVLDNARDVSQVRPLLPGTPTCLVLVTSRDRLTGLVATDGAHPLPVSLLTPAESRELLLRRLGRDRISAEPTAFEVIVERCAGLPLALAIVAARALNDRALPLGTLAHELSDDRRLDTLAVDDPDSNVRAVFFSSYRALSPRAARLFRLLGVEPGPTLSSTAAASLVGLPVTETGSLLAELGQANLISEDQDGRFSCHDLLRAYAAHLARTTDEEGELREAVHRILDHYAHSARHADAQLSPDRADALPPARPGVTPDRPTGHADALTWFHAEYRSLIAAVDHAAAMEDHPHAYRLADGLVTFLDRRGRWHQWLRISHIGAAAAQRMGDRAAQTRTYRVLAAAYTELERFDEAYTALLRAIDVLADSDDLIGRGHTHHLLAYVCGRRKRDRDALDHGHRALDLYREAGLRTGQGYALNTVGWHNALLGNYEAGLVQCEQALAIHRELDDTWGMAGDLDSLGYIQHALRHHDQAARYYVMARDLYQELGDRHEEAVTLTRLGDARRSAGDRAAARRAWQQALRILDDLDHPDAEQVRMKIRSVGSPG